MLPFNSSPSFVASTLLPLHEMLIETIRADKHIVNKNLFFIIFTIFITIYFVSKVKVKVKVKVKETQNFTVVIAVSLWSKFPLLSSLCIL